MQVRQTGQHLGTLLVFPSYQALDAVHCLLLDMEVRKGWEGRTAAHGGAGPHSWWDPHKGPYRHTTWGQTQYWHPALLGGLGHASRLWLLVMPQTK